MLEKELIDNLEFIKDILKKIFNKGNKIKEIEESKTIQIKQQDKLKFIDSLKINETEKQRKKGIRTLTCIGDGLGIQNKISS